MALNFKNIYVEVKDNDHWGTCTVTKTDDEGNVEFISNFRIQVPGTTNVDDIQDFIIDHVTILLGED